MQRKVNRNSRSHFVYLPNRWYNQHIHNGWDGKIVDVSSTSQLLIKPYPEDTQNFILSKTPLRIPLGGGGTDLPEFYNKHGGQWISASINSYIRVILKKRFEEQSKFVYSETQYVDEPSQFTHPILRAVLTKYNLIQHLELISIADLPAHLGLGSSGAFTVGLLKALHTFLNLKRDTYDIAEEAYEIERLTLNRKIGKQDQFATAYGGLNIYTAFNTGQINVTHLNCPNLQKWLLLFYVNQRQIPADEALSFMSETDRTAIFNIGKKSIEALQNNNLQQYGHLVDKHWTIKSRSQPPYFDQLIQHAKHYGASGGKLCGAGNGGCLLLVCPPEHQLSVIDFLQSQNCKQIPFEFESFGSEVYQ